MRFELVVLVLGFMFSASTLLMVPPLPAKLSVNATEEEKQQRVVLMKERRRCQVAVNHDKRAKGLERTSKSVDVVAVSNVVSHGKRARGAERTADEVDAVAGSNNKRTTSEITASNSKRATSDIAASNSKRARGSERTAEEVDAVAASNIGTNSKRAKGTM